MTRNYLTDHSINYINKYTRLHDSKWQKSHSCCVSTEVTRSQLVFVGSLVLLLCAKRDKLLKHYELNVFVPTIPYQNGCQEKKRSVETSLEALSSFSWEKLGSLAHFISCLSS